MNLRLCAILNCNMPVPTRVCRGTAPLRPTLGRVGRVLSGPQSRTNLVEQLLQARGIARRTAEAGMRIELSEFPDSGRKIRRIHGYRKLEWCLRHLANYSAPRQQTQEFRVQPRRKLWIRTRGLRRAKLPRQPQTLQHCG